MKNAKQWLAHFALEQRGNLTRSPSLERIRALLDVLENPQKKLHIVHIAGTSGKGSTAQATASLLQALGWRVGLHISPHIFDVRERFQINGELISNEKLDQLLDKTLPALEKIAASPLSSPTYFELLVAMSYVLFAEEEVDVAVIETGMGGRFDATNVAKGNDKIAMITNIGLDHTAYLGKTLRRIAGEKAGIIHYGNQVFSAWQPPAVREVIEERCREQRAALEYVGKETIRHIRVTPQGTIFDFHSKQHIFRDLKTNLIGAYQAKNIGLALFALEEVCAREHKPFDETRIRSALVSLHVPGRFEIRTMHGRPVILDVAHNPQKIRSLLHTLKKLWPNTPATFVLAFGNSADHTVMLQLITPHAAQIIFSDFLVQDSDYPFRFTDPDALQNIAIAGGYKNSTIIRDNPTGTIDAALKHGTGPIVITGYFHFVAAMERMMAAQNSSNSSYKEEDMKLRPPSL